MEEFDTRGLALASVNRLQSPTLFLDAPHDHNIPQNATVVYLSGIFFSKVYIGKPSAFKAGLTTQGMRVSSVRQGGERAKGPDICSLPQCP